ncbi:hypothetical protein [Oceaniferula spumae]|uniref:hypothetical protein n=1 Tax=Oceaniferula spumae TaxID=2979115 RepID=UPI003F4E63D1
MTPSLRRRLLIVGFSPCVGTHYLVVFDIHDFCIGAIAEVVQLGRIVGGIEEKQSAAHFLWERSNVYLHGQGI